jgi:predicted PurR-regulated permease PerM
LPSPIVNALNAFQIGDLEQIQLRIALSLGQAAQTIASLAISIGQGTMELTISLGITLYLLFRDGPELVTTISKASPARIYACPTI